MVPYRASTRSRSRSRMRAGVIGSRDYNFVLDKGTPTMTPYASGAGIPGCAYYLEPSIYPLGRGVDRHFLSCRGRQTSTSMGTRFQNARQWSWTVNLLYVEILSWTLALASTPSKSTIGRQGMKITMNPPMRVARSPWNPGFIIFRAFSFRDNDQDGVFDYDSEVRLYDSWTINLDQDCDGVVDMTVTTNPMAGTNSTICLGAIATASPRL